MDGKPNEEKTSKSSHQVEEDLQKLVGNGRNDTFSSFPGWRRGECKFVFVERNPDSVAIAKLIVYNFNKCKLLFLRCLQNSVISLLKT